MNAVTGGLYHVQGEAVLGDRAVPWSVVLKVLVRPDDTVEDQRAGHYWRRESLAYRDKVFDELPPGLGAPRCLGIDEPGEGRVWLWMEDVTGLPAAGWPLRRYGTAAADLGRWQGRYLAGEPLPAYRWLSRGCLEELVPFPEPGRLKHLADERAWRHPLLREVLPGGCRQAVLDLWARRDDRLAELGSGPPTLCHFDVWPGNLVAGRAPGDDQRETVLLDWARLGEGPPAADLATLILDSVWLMQVDLAALGELEGLVLDGYAAGLREAGWRGDDDMLWGWYARVASLRFGLLAHRLLTLAHDEENRVVESERAGRGASAPRGSHRPCAVAGPTGRGSRLTVYARPCTGGRRRSYTGRTPATPWRSAGPRLPAVEIDRSCPRRPT